MIIGTFVTVRPSGERTNITAQEILWDETDERERAKMQQWVKVGGYSLILWWAVIGGLLMTYLYSVAGLAYLHEEFLKTGGIPSGVMVPLQMATIAQGVLGPMAGWLMLSSSWSRCTMRSSRSTTRSSAAPPATPSPSPARRGARTASTTSWW